MSEVVEKNADVSGEQTEDLGVHKHVGDAVNKYALMVKKLADMRQNNL